MNTAAAICLALTCFFGIVAAVLACIAILSMLLMPTYVEPPPESSNSWRDPRGHRWSGWPGAYCWYCYHEDPMEIAIADWLDPFDEISVRHFTSTLQPCPIGDAIKDRIDLDMNPRKPL
jgi:hypothetical protein